MRHSALRFFLLIALLLCYYPSHAHESCCKHKLQKAIASEFIDDPNDTPPAEFQGQPRYLIDENDIRPDDWDDDEDGPWEPNEIANPKYEWKPRQIPNPNYVPPPTFWDKLRSEIQMAVPWVTLGVLITGVATCSFAIPFDWSLLDWWKKSEKKNTSGNTWMAALLGLATPLCSCGALPVAAGFWNEGIPPNSVIAFLTASQSAGIDSAAITYGLLGPMGVFSRLFGATILAIVAGQCLPTKSSSQPSGTKMKNTSTITKATEESLIRLFLETLADTAYEVFPSVLLGLALSTAVVHYLPSILHPTNFDSDGNPLLAVLIRWSILASALPLQLCEHTTVTLAAAIQKAGASPGLAFGFLLSAPATNLPTLLLVTQKMIGVKQPMLFMLRMAVAISSTALLFSYAVDYFDLDLLVQEEAKASAGMASFPPAYLKASPWIAGTLFVSGVARTLLVSRSKSAATESTAENGESECCASCPPVNDKKNN